MTVPTDTQTILDILKWMTDVERAIARIYRRCAETWKAEEAFWLGLEEAEIKHANNIGAMAEIIRRTPDRFQLNRPFNITAIKTVLSGIEQNIDRLDKKLISRESMLVLAHDIEASVLEKAYHEIVKTDDLAYLTLVKQVVSETIVHIKAIANKIREGTASQ